MTQVYLSKIKDESELMLEMAHSFLWETPIFHFVLPVLAGIHPHGPADMMQDLRKTCVGPERDLEAKAKIPEDISNSTSCPGLGNRAELLAHM